MLNFLYMLFLMNFAMATTTTTQIIVMHYTLQWLEGNVEIEVDSQSWYDYLNESAFGVYAWWYSESLSIDTSNVDAELDELIKEQA